MNAKDRTQTTGFFLYSFREKQLDFKLCLSFLKKEIENLATIKFKIIIIKKL